MTSVSFVTTTSRRMREHLCGALRKIRQIERERPRFIFRDTEKCPFPVTGSGVVLGMGSQKDQLAVSPFPPVPVDDVTRVIVAIRGRKVLLDSELAALYGVTTKRLNEQVRRNQERFPPDFMFQLTAEETAALRSHSATSNTGPAGRGGRRYPPYVFTEHGAIMAATVLNSPHAIEMSVYVVRAFLKLRELLASNRVLARKLDELEKRLTMRLDAHDEAIAAILSAIRELTHAPPTTRAIGFTATLD